MKDGHTRWDRIRRLQQANAGKRLIKPSIAWKENGSLTQGNEELTKRWKQNFLKALNATSEL